MILFDRINRCDIFVGVWIIYRLQDILYPQGIINQMLQLIMMLWLILESKSVFLDKTIYSRYLCGTRTMLYMFIIYGILLIIENPQGIRGGTYLYLQNALNSFLPIFMFFKYARNGLLTVERMQFYFILFFPVVYYNSQFALAKKIAESLSGKTEFTDNTGYQYLVLLPLLGFYCKKPIVQYVLSFFLFIVILQSMKRGAIFICVVGLLYLIYKSYKNSKGFFKILIVFISFVLLLGSIYYFQYMLENSVYFTSRFERTMEGDSSGRDDLYDAIISSFINESNPFYLLFGHGAFHTYLEIGNYAHQDWLEILYNNGLMGVVLFLSYFSRFFKEVRYILTTFRDPIVISFGLVFIVTFMKTMFSMSILEMSPPITMVLGFMVYYSSRDFKYYYNL